MAEGLNYAYYVYTTDGGTEYSVRLASYFGDNEDLGFGARDDTKPLLPKGSKMRYVNALDFTTGNRRKVPVGTNDSDIFTGVATSVDLKFYGDAVANTFDVTSRRGEKIAVSHRVYNL